MRKILTSCIIIVSLLVRGFAQDVKTKPERQLSIGLGSSHTSVQDNQLSPLVYRGSGFLLDFIYTNQDEKGYWETLWNTSKYNLSPKFNPISTTEVENQLINLNFEYLRRANSGKANHDIGLGLYNHLSVRTYDFRVGDEVAVDFFSSLNLVYSFHTILQEKHNFRLKLSYPFIGYVVNDGSSILSQGVYEEILEDTEARPSFGKTLKGGKFQSINRFSDLRFVANYFLDLSAHFSLGLFYSLHFPTYDESRQVKMGTSQYVTRIAYQF